MPAQLLVLAPLHHAQAERQQFQNLEFALRLVYGREFLRLVERAQVVHDRSELQVVGEFPRTQSRQREPRKVENGLVQPAEELLFHAGLAAGFANRVYGLDAPAELLVFVERLHVGVRNLQSPVFADLPRDEPARAVLDFPGPETCTAEEKQLYFSSAVGECRYKPRGAPANGSRPRNRPDEHDLFAHAAVADGGDLGLVQVGAGDVVEQVGDGIESRLAEGLYALGPESR